jgi:uncharacterized protein
MKGLHSIAFILVIVGGINWGLVALGSWAGSNWNIVNLIFGQVSGLEDIVYLLVGLSALFLVFSHKQDCRLCGVSGGAV